jgi:hypothetical protein
VVIIILLSLFQITLSGCSGGGNPSPNNTKENTDGRKKETADSFFPTPSPTPQPKIGEKTDYLHLEETIEAEGMETIQITTLTWCETALNAEGKTYCLANEVGQMKQGAKVGYFTRRFDFQKREKGLTTNLDPSRSLWESSSSDWDETETLRAKTPLQKAHVTANLQGYREFLETEHRLLTDRCREVPEWAEIRELTPARQGHLEIVPGSFSDLHRKNRSIMTLLELDFESLEVRFIATLFDRRLGFDDPIPYQPELHANDSLAEYDAYTATHHDRVEVLQAANLRDDHLVRRFALACDRSYEKFAHEKYPRYCKYSWTNYLPVYNSEIDDEASKIFVKRMSEWRTAETFKWSRLFRPLYDLNILWRDLPIPQRSDVPQLCLSSYPSH